MSIMFCCHCDHYIDTDSFPDNQWEPDFKCGNCVEQENEEQEKENGSWWQFIDDDPEYQESVT